MNYFLNLIFILFLTFNVSSQSEDAKSPLLFKSTLNSVHASSVSVDTYRVLQSTGQMGNIGEASDGNISVQQGFLTNPMVFTLSYEQGVIIDENLSLSLFPNPFVDFTTLQFSKKTEQNIDIEIYNNMGQLVSQFSFEPSIEVTIPVSTLACGNYMINVRVGLERISEKALKISN